MYHFSASPCVFTIAAGTPVRLTANSPATPGIFNNGSGDASGCSTSTCNFTINNNSSITTTFDPALGPFPSVSIGLGGDGKGEVGADNNRCQNFELGFSACTVYYGVGSEVRLDGRSVPGNIFANFWGGTADAASCASSPCMFTLNSNSSVNANFFRLISLAVQPNTATINVGGMQPFTAVGTFTNFAMRSLFGGFGTWSTKRSLINPTFDFGLGALNQRIYAVGGGIGGSPSNFVEVYNPAVGPLGLTDSWTAVGSLNIPREGHGVAVAGGRLYAIGGSTSDNVLIASVEVYDPVANTWDATPGPMPTARSHFATAVVGNVIYALGGGTVLSPLQIVEAYDTSSNTWSTKTPMPTARTFFAAAAVNGVIYAFGDPSGTVDAYDTSTNTRSTMTSMPHPRSALVAGAIDGLIYAVGGENPAATGIVDVYNPATDTWTTLASMPTPRDEAALVVLDGRLFVAGGLATVDSSSVLSTFEAFRPPETTWWSSNTAVASIDPNGMATGLRVARRQSTRARSGSTARRRAAAPR